MGKSVLALLLLGVIGYVSAQRGSCARQVVHDSFTDSRGQTHNYFFSWQDTGSPGGFTWSQASNFCRRNCMELVSLETPPENNYVKRYVGGAGVNGIWTTGRKSGFGRASLVNGWSWGTGESIRAADSRLNGDWSDAGASGRPQPDNNAALRGGGDEGCLAVLNNRFRDGIKWHDEDCNQRLSFVCEGTNVGGNRQGREFQRPNTGGGNFGRPNINGGNDDGRPNVGGGNFGRPNTNRGNAGRPNVGGGNFGRPNTNGVETGFPNVGSGNFGPPNTNGGNVGRPNTGGGNNEQGVVFLVNGAGNNGQRNNLAPTIFNGNGFPPSTQGAGRFPNNLQGGFTPQTNGGRNGLGNDEVFIPFENIVRGNTGLRF